MYKKRWGFVPKPFWLQSNVSQSRFQPGSRSASRFQPGSRSDWLGSHGSFVCSANSVSHLVRRVIVRAQQGMGDRLQHQLRFGFDIGYQPFPIVVSLGSLTSLPWSTSSLLYGKLGVQYLSTSSLPSSSCLQGIAGERRYGTSWATYLDSSLRVLSNPQIAVILDFGDGNSYFVLSNPILRGFVSEVLLISYYFCLLIRKY